MKNKVFLAGLVGVALIFGLVLAGCDDGSPAASLLFPEGSYSRSEGNDNYTLTLTQSGNLSLVRDDGIYPAQDVIGNSSGGLYPDTIKFVATTTSIGINATLVVSFDMATMTPVYKTITGAGTFAYTANSITIGGLSYPFENLNGIWSRN
ncbi:MAG: hypothetical protein LBI86_03310 [Treponema sp.]|jgi:hypothetical protein|nr:hypothetical protein [Treponema sp.]